MLANRSRAAGGVHHLLTARFDDSTSPSGRRFHAEREVADLRQQRRELQLPRVAQVQPLHHVADDPPDPQGARRSARIHEREHFGQHLDAAGERLVEHLPLGRDEKVLAQARFERRDECLGVARLREEAEQGAAVHRRRSPLRCRPDRSA